MVDRTDHPTSEWGKYYRDFYAISLLPREIRVSYKTYNIRFIRIKEIFMENLVPSPSAGCRTRNGGKISNS